MRLSGVLETFDKNINSGVEAGNFSSEVIEDQKLASFESGYRAGWEDAVEASKTSDREMYEKIGKEVLQLQETQHSEFETIVAKVLTFNATILNRFFVLSKETILVEKICQKIEEEIISYQDSKILLVVSEKKDGDFLKNMQAAVGQKIDVKIDPSLRHGDMKLGIGTSEWEFNLEAVVVEMTEVLLDLKRETHKEAWNEGIG